MHMTRKGLALPLLCLMLVPAPACKGPPQLPEVETAGLRISVLRSKNTLKGLDVMVRVCNEYDQRITFDLGGVRLIYADGSELSPTPSRRQPEVQAKNHGDFRWIFSYQSAPRLEAGTYDMEIKDICVGDIMIDMKAQFQVVVD
jgi:hypothetical protein